MEISSINRFKNEIILNGDIISVNIFIRAEKRMQTHSDWAKSKISTLIKKKREKQNEAWEVNERFLKVSLTCMGWNRL